MMVHFFASGHEINLNQNGNRVSEKQLCQEDCVHAIGPFESESNANNAMYNACISTSFT